ncbi:hypothetical protein BC332_17926 [Capsicum chinense]|nr:hypothetical protein BC332_17926 [Capsicum chinense]
MNERQPQRPCGCVGIFFQLFDQNRRFAKKLFPKKLLSPACLKQASKKFGGDEKQPKLRLDKVLAESVDSVDDEPLFPEPDRDLSDCETSLSTRRSCRELIHNVSGVLSKTDQLKGSKLSYVKQVILNAELIFGTTPQQQALPVEDGFSVSHFLLNEHELFSSFLWMAFGELLGCNDPKQMNQLKGFAFDCLLEYLDSKCSPISDSGFRTCTKLPSSMTKEILIADIIDEVEEWTQFVGLIPDELIEWDMSHSLGKCTDFEIEEYECGTEVDRHIL